MSDSMDRIRLHALAFLRGRKRNAKHGRGATLVEICDLFGLGKSPGVVSAALHPLTVDGTLAVGKDPAGTGLDHYRLLR